MFVVCSVCEQGIRVTDQQVGDKIARALNSNRKAEPICLDCYNRHEMNQWIVEAWERAAHMDEDRLN